jgi:DNA-binding IclR family transcriptional regulator
MTLKEAATPLGQAEIAAVTGMQQGSVRRMLGEMVAKGEIEKSARGCYRAILKGNNSSNNWVDRN